MQILSHLPFLKALGWTLLNSLWQFAVLWVVFLVFLKATKKNSPAFKHGLALALVFTGFTWFAAGLSLRYFQYSGTVQNDSPGYTIAGNSYFHTIYNGGRTMLETNLPYISVIYLLVVIVFFIRFFRYFFYTHTLQTSGLSKINPSLRLYVQRLVQRLNINPRVTVWVSDNIDTPMVVGFLKPVILIPVACITQLSTNQVEAILLHELAHIKRNDYLVNLSVATLEILFFFNPFCQLLLKSIREEREKSCDDWVLQFRFDPYQYASALLSLEQHRSSSFPLAIPATGKNKNLLLERVQRILGVPTKAPEPGFKLLANLLTIGILGFVALVNPGNLVVENLEKNRQTFNVLVNPNTTVNEINHDKTVLTFSPLKEKTVFPREPERKILPVDTMVTEDTDSWEEQDFIPVSMNVDEEEVVPHAVLLHSTPNENKGFSIPETDPELPITAPESDYPFVPSSSYSYFNTEDTTIIKFKAEKLNEKAIKQSLAQAQKAIEQLNWTKIAKSQKLSKTAIITLQKELQTSLQNINWVEIYKQSMDSIQKATTDQMRSSLKLEYDKVNQYRALQDQYEIIKSELIKQQDSYKKGVERNIKEIEKQVHKIKITVHI